MTLFRKNDQLDNLLNEFPSGTAFEQLPGELTKQDIGNSESLYLAFERVFHSAHAKQASNGVYIWSTDGKFTHSEGNMLESRIVYIEKSDHSFTYRWPRRYLRNLSSDDGCDGKIFSRPTLRDYARHDYNFSFYTNLIRDFGPLRIYWAPLEKLNERYDQLFLSSRAWERQLNRMYRSHNGCLPLKNRRL